MTPTRHIVEPGGRGGVYHHAVGLAIASAGAGRAVVLHTASDAEDVGAPTVRTRACFWRFSGLQPRLLRRVAVTAGWLVVGVPLCAARFRPGDVVDIHGWFRPWLLAPLAMAARLRRCRLVLTPHNTFSRRARRSAERAMAWMARRADEVVVFSDHDLAALRAWGSQGIKAPLLAAPAKADPDLVARWRTRWRARGGVRRVVLFAGQIRPDKGLDALVRAAAGWEGDARLAVVGEDVGALRPALGVAGALGVALDVDEGYQPWPQFVAAVAAADVVVCPYRVASQSAILALARVLGRPTVATDVGGLGELATVTVPPHDVAALAAAVHGLLAAATPVDSPAG